MEKEPLASMKEPLAVTLLLARLLDIENKGRVFLTAAIFTLETTLFPDLEKAHWQLYDLLSDLVYLFLGTELSLYLGRLSSIATGPCLYQLCGRTGLAGAGVRIGVGGRKKLAD